jgi:plastin-1
MMILKEVVRKEVNFLMKGFRMWVNSLGIDDLHINNLYEEFKDGLALLKIIDKVKPGCVDWKKVEKAPSNKFKKLANTKMCVDLCK